MAGRQYQIQISADLVKFYASPWVLGHGPLVDPQPTEKFARPGSPLISAAPLAGERTLDPKDKTRSPTRKGFPSSSPLDR